MPPSGYSKSQSQYAVNFLESCFQSLVAEAKEKELSLRQALDIEVDNIHAHLNSDVSLPSQDAILRLTLSFYEAINNSDASDDIEISRLATTHAHEIGIDILSIKIDEFAYSKI